MATFRDKLLNVLGDLITGAGVTVIAGASAPPVIIAAASACAAGLLSQAIVQTKGEKAAQLEGDEKFRSMMTEFGNLKKVLSRISSEQDAGQIFSAEKVDQLLTAVEAHAKGSSEASALSETILRDIEERLARWCNENGTDLNQFFTDVQTAIASLKQEIVGFRAEQRTAADENSRQHSKTQGAVQEVLDRVSSFKPAGPALDAFGEIEKAVTLIKDGSPAVAIYVLETLRKKHWSSLSAREQYRVLANLGVAHFQHDGDFRQTAKLFLEAAQADPSHENALCLQANAYMDLDEPSRALDLAKEAVTRSPMSVPAHAVHVRAMPSSLKFQDVEAAVPKHLREENEVATALGMRALLDSSTECRAPSQDELARAEKYLSIPCVLAQKQPIVIAQLGMVIIESERQKCLEHDFEPVISDKTRFNAGIAHIEDALKGTRGFLPPEWRGRALHACGVAHSLLGEKGKADRNFEDAYGYIPNDTGIVLHRSVILHERSDTNSAIELLVKHHVDGPLKPAGLMLCKLLIRRHQNDDVTRAESILRMGVGRLTEVEPELRIQIVDLLVGLLQSEGRHAAADEMLGTLTPGALDPIAILTLRSDIARSMGRADDAQRQIEEAVRSIQPDTPNEVRFMAAVASQDCGRHDLAFPLLRLLLPPNRILPETPRLLLAAQSLAEDAFILDYCETLRQHGVLDWRAIGLEADVLLEYNEPGKAIELLRSFLASNPAESQAQLARVQLGNIGIRCQRPDLIETSLAKLPSVQNVGASWGEATACVIRATDPTAAINYAYQLVRRYFDKPAAHRALISTLAPFADKPVCLPSYASVGPNAAVRFRERGAGQDEWWVIETDTTSPVEIGRRELPANHPLAAELTGKQVNDTFFIDQNNLQDRVGEVLEIVDKRVYRLRDSAFHFRERFPDEPFFILSMNLAKADGTFDADPIIRSVQQRAKQVEDIETLVRTQRLPTATMALWLKATVVDTIAYLGRNGGPRQFCCEGDLGELENATKLTAAASTVVLDASAMSVLMLSGAYRHVKRGKLRLLVSEGTVEEFRRLHRDSISSGSQSSIGSFSKHGNQVVLLETSKEERAAREGLFSQFLAWVNANLEIVNGLALARLRPEAREPLISVCGRPTAETIAIAHSSGYLFWSDDSSLVRIVKDQFSVNAVWSQVMMDRLVVSEQTSFEGVDRVARWLISHRFHFVRVSHPTIIRAAKESYWNGSADPLRTMLNIFAEQNSEPEGLMHFAIRSLYELCRAAPTMQDAFSAVESLLDHWALHRRGIPDIWIVHANATKIYWPDMSMGLLIQGHLSRWLRRRYRESR